MFGHMGLAVSYVYLGREEDAHDEAAEVLRINPKFSVKRYAKHIQFKDQACKERFFDALRKTGLPE